MRRLRRAFANAGQGKWVFLSALVLAIAVAPFAVAADGDPVKAGGRTTFTKITRILGNSTTYATQQSNLMQGDGGAARYGCRSAPGREHCLMSKNVGGSGAFRFVAENSVIGGEITVKPPQGKGADDARPFTTNATGVATGLNADRVDGLHADELRPRFARVNADGTLVNQRGVQQASRTGVGTYALTFSQPIANCAIQATPAALEDVGVISAEQTSDTVATVRTRDATGADADRPFSVTVVC
ncbi:MAG TPA: hypothetical protein VIM86_12735 [Thermodesulfobacteriota bacterium]|jgi:hypothetical protein